MQNFYIDQKNSLIHEASTNATYISRKDPIILNLLYIALLLKETIFTSYGNNFTIASKAPIQHFYIDLKNLKKNKSL